MLPWGNVGHSVRNRHGSKKFTTAIAEPGEQWTGALRSSSAVVTVNKGHKGPGGYHSNHWSFDYDFPLLSFGFCAVPADFVAISIFSL